MGEHPIFRDHVSVDLAKQNDAFVFYSGYTEEQLEPGYHMLLNKISDHCFDKLYLYKKYAHKKFLKAAVYALEKAREHVGQGEGMVLA